MGGGDTWTAYEYVEAAGGLDAATDYPSTSNFSGQTGSCKWDGSKAATVTGADYATKPCEYTTGGACDHQDEEAVAAALSARGPLSACVFASIDWVHYKGGVF